MASSREVSKSRSRSRSYRRRSRRSASSNDSAPRGRERRESKVSQTVTNNYSLYRLELTTKADNQSELSDILCMFVLTYIYACTCAPVHTIVVLSVYSFVLFSQAADQEIDQVVINLDLYHQLNIKNDICVMTKIQHGHDV